VRYVELFAGAGGLSLGLDAAGMTCVAHAELEPHAQSVLRRHWPDTPLHGDVTQVDWTPYAGRVDLVSGGSPCQDLSVAGKRAGLDGARSGLFYELIRAWDETGAPYLLWENVDGARSSNAGADFAAVLSALVGAAVAVPERWASAGVAAGPTGVAAWRVLDLQHFGPPQRRRRVFVLAARTGGVDPAEILAVSESVCGHPAPRERSRQGTAEGAAGGVGGSDVAFAVRGRETGAVAEASDIAPSLRTPGGGSSHAHVLAFHYTQDPISGSVSLFIGRTTDGMGVVQTLVVGGRDKGANDSYDNTPVVAAHVNDVPSSIAFNWQNGGGYGTANDGLGITIEGTGPLSRSQVMAVTQPAVLCTTGHVTHAHAWPEVAMPLMARDAKGPRNFQDGGLQISAVQVGRPRRLTPLECERLMSWPDGWTAHGVREDGTQYALSDTARYRLCGNGVGSVVAAWIARRLVWAETHTPTAATGRVEAR
jgi:DNA (cytosine-5)-methyltransferase 1